MLTLAGKEFVANFASSTLDFENYYTVMFYDTVVAPDQWQDITTLAQRRTVNLSLRSGR